MKFDFSFAYELLIVSAVALAVAMWMILRGPSLVLKLLLRYLAKRRIAWVALIAVMLCTAMVLVVISVMGGWLTMFRQSFHGLTGDVIVKSESLLGFPYYQEMIDRIEKDPSVAAAVPMIETYGLFNIQDVPTSPVQVLGLPLERIGEVNRLPDSLFRQHTQIEDELKENKSLSPETRARLEAKLTKPPTFALLDRTYAPLSRLPADIRLADTSTNRVFVPDKGLANRLFYDSTGHRLIFRGIMTPDERTVLSGLTGDSSFKQALETLFSESNSGKIVDYKGRLPNVKGDVSTWPGMITGIGVVYVSRDKEGQWRSPFGSRMTTDLGSLYAQPVKLTVLGLNTGGDVDLSNKAERSYWIVDTSRTQIWQYDNKDVYVPFDRLQIDLGMNEKKATDRQTGAEVILPARTSQIHVRMKAGTDMATVKTLVERHVMDVLREHSADEAFSSAQPYVETWEESQKTWLDAIENEKLLTVMLFSIISLVAIFLIFCIFYMIVVEKTKDIGILKSVGATSNGVMGIFLGYGLAIGVVGSGMGLFVSYLLIHNINELHHLLGKAFGIQIWNPEVYLFDKIPNTMSLRDTVVIVGVAILSSVLGALLPALRAAGMNPVEALRWE